MALVTGTKLGTYEILGALGAGGMGEVYRARDLRLGREIALKVLPAGMTASAERLARFEREARTVAGLSHPNIVVLHSVEDDGGVRFLTMELVEGRSLDHSLAPGGLPIPRVIELGIALADALAAAHEKGVVHRDLKPANVMLTKDGRVKVLDFGLAKLAAADSSAELTQAATMATPLSSEGQVVGTVPYMAPEQIRGEAVDARSDLFSLGVMLYELACGKRPFAGASTADLCSAILRDVPEPLGKDRRDVPPELERIVSECLEKNPRERIQTALDVSNALRRLRREMERSDPRVPVTPPKDKVASIAVLPFVNRSASADDEYFSDGLADELLNVLSKIKGLRVTARSSSSQFRGTRDDTATIGRKLNVATLLEGSVRKAGNRIRVSVQLVNVADSSHLWSETYDRTLDDIFAVQDDIAHAVVKELRSALLGEADDSDASGAAKAEVAQAAKGRAMDPEAHRLYLLAKHLIGRRTREEAAKGVEYLQAALERDPDFGLAWSELSRVYSTQADKAWTPAKEGYARARAAAERALALDPNDAGAYTQLAAIQINFDWDFRGAEQLVSRALALAPMDADVLNRAGTLRSAFGRPDEAIALHRRAVELDPLHSGCYLNLGLALDESDRPEEAEVAFRKALEIAPQGAGMHAALGLVLLDQGRGDEALAEASLELESWARLWALAILHHRLGRPGDSDRALQELIERHGSDSAAQIADVYGARGEVDEAFNWLERGYTEHDAGITSAAVSPRLRALHGDPRWDAFLKKMGIKD